MNVHRTRFDWALLAFFSSALWGGWVSYDTGTAARCLTLICGGIFGYYVLALMPSHVTRGRTDIPLLRIVVGVTPALIALYFAVTHDWTQPVEKVAWLEPLRQWLGARQPRLDWPRLHPNTAGGVLAMWLPLQAAALRPRPRREGARLSGTLLRFGGVVLLGASSAGLLLSGLRGAWLALAVAAMATLAWQFSDRMLCGRSAWVRLALWAGGAAAAIALLAGTSAAGHWLALRPDRVLVWRNSWDLAWDYAFTGLGLGAFPMAYSSYALLVHVPHTAHAHNLVLDIWLAQGLAGLIAFAWLLVAALAPVAVTSCIAPASSTARGSRWRSAATVSVLTLFLHGLLDDVSYGYGGVGALALFVPFALLARRSAGTPRRPVRSSRRVLIALAGTAAISLALAAVHPAVRAQVAANRGALQQTRAELSVYRWPAWPVQDALRRSDAVNLGPALRHYHEALALDARNVTANRRVGQIELSRAQYR